MLTPRTLFAVSLACGILVGASLFAVTVMSSTTDYWSTSVSVSRAANESNPYVLSFHGATFTMWWPPILPGASSGVPGVSIDITEPSGVIVQTGTGCAACDTALHTWYSPDGTVGISWYDRSMGDVTVLVRM